MFLKTGSAMLKRHQLMILLVTTLTALSGCSRLTSKHLESSKPLDKSTAGGVTYYLGKPVFRVDHLATAGGKEAHPAYKVAAG